MSGSLTFATFNVKDLIEEAFAAPPGREAVAASAKQAKLQCIADEVVRADPHVLGLQEVGSQALVQGVVDRVAARTGAEYRIVMGTVDARGIGCAIVTRLPLASSRVHQTDALPFPGFDPADPPPFGERLPLRRGVVHATVATPLGTVDVLVAHLKSRRGVPARDTDGNSIEVSGGVAHGEGLLRAMVWRGSEALFVRGLADDLFAAEPDARIVVMGDLNDDVASAPLQIVRGPYEARLRGVETLVPRERRFSILHGGKNEAPRGQQIDHILLSPSLHELAVTAAIQNESLRRHEFPVEGELPSADSDHALYSVTLRVPPTAPIASP